MKSKIPHALLFLGPGNLIPAINCYKQIMIKTNKNIFNKWSGF
ncbi:MAG: hypothetical protein ACE19M_00105 [Candidatus Karelsulcia muelleri]